MERNGLDLRVQDRWFFIAVFNINMFDSCVSSWKRHEGFTTLLTLHRNDHFSQVTMMFGEFIRNKRGNMFRFVVSAFDRDM